MWRTALALLPLILCSAVVLASRSKVLLVSMDGFRWDYLNQVPTPHFDAFARNGVKVPYMNNSFTTKTFPNHYTLITGLYEESHGITANQMYDPVFDETFTMRTKDPRWWDEGEPLWVTARNQGVKTASYFWIGSDVKIRGVRPDIWLNYKESVPFQPRVDTVVDWFKNKGVEFASLYFHEPDATGHKYGPGSPEVRLKVKDMDAVLGYLVQSMRDNGLEPEVDVIVVSDHGMATSVRKTVDITDHVDMSKVVRVPIEGVVLQLEPVQGEEDTVYQALSSVDHITVYKKEDMPEHFHYKNNRRIMPIIVIADEGWLATTSKTVSQAKGQHGYDNRLMSMKPIFLAKGPSFKTNYIGSTILNVDIYPLVCRLLNITPAPNNGTVPMELLRVVDIVG